MASIVERNNRYYVVYTYKNDKGETKQKWESCGTKSNALKRKKEIDYKMDIGTFVVPNCKTMGELLDEYEKVYGREKWAMSTYGGNVSLIRNYILPFLKDVKLSNINIRFIENYYQKLLKTPAVVNPSIGKPSSEFVSTSTVRDIHKLLRNCFEQAVKWELMEKNPCIYATVPKHKAKERDIWTAKTLQHFFEICTDERLKLAVHLSFACSMRIGEITGLTWDCVDISEEAIASKNCYVFINKEYQRVSKESIQNTNGKGIITVFPEQSKKNRTVRILKEPKTESSVRKVYLPPTVARMLKEWKDEQDETKAILGEEYMDYNLVFAGTFGLPCGSNVIRKSLAEFIKEHNFPPIVFHSFRHASITYKLKLSGGDVKSVQGDSGHSQMDMVTDIYSHIIDEDRKENAALFEEAFYGKKNLDPVMNQSAKNKNMNLPEGVNQELLTKVLSNPEMVALLKSMANALQ